MGGQDGLASVKRAAIAVVALLFAILRVVPINDPDYHWHLATGRYILQHRAIPRLDPFSHTAYGMRWTFVDWVSDVGMYLLRRAGGDALVVIAFASLGALGIALAAERARRRIERASSAMVLAIAMLVAAVVSYRISPRPQTAVFPLCAWLLLVTDRARSSPRALVLVPAIIALWQNLHSSALLGVAIVAAYALERRTRDWMLTGLASAAAMFLTVRPVDRFLAGFAHLGDPRVADLFPEWGPPFVEGVIGGWTLAALIILLLAAIGAAARAGSLGEHLSVAMLALVGCFSARMLPLAVIAAAPLALEGLAQMAEHLKKTVVVATTIAIAVVCSIGRLALPGVGLAKNMYPERAASFVRDRGWRAKLFNDFRFGGYLIWALPDDPVFVDGRSMAIYGVEFVREAALATDERLAELIQQYGATIAIVPPDRRMGFLQRLPGWSLVMFDDAAAVLVREDAVPGAASFAYRALTPGRWFDVAWMREDPGRLALMEKELVRAGAEAPDSAQIAVLRVTLADAAGDHARAAAALADAEARFPRTNRVLRARLIHCTEVDDRPCACAAASTIAREFPNNTYASMARVTLNCP